MKDSTAVRIFGSLGYFGDQSDTFLRVAPKRSRDIAQTATRRKLHTEEWQSVRRFADFVDGKNVRVIETGRCFRFATKADKRLA